MSESGLRHDDQGRDAGRPASGVATDDAGPAVSTDELRTDGGQATSKDSGIAMVGSLLFPGLGQLYVGNGARAAAIFVGWLVWEAIALVLTIVTFGLFLIVWLLGELAVHLVAAYDAYKQAESYNATATNDGTGSQTETEPGSATPGQSNARSGSRANSRSAGQSNTRAGAQSDTRPSTQSDTPSGTRSDAGQDTRSESVSGASGNTDPDETTASSDGDHSDDRDSSSSGMDWNDL